MGLRPSFPCLPFQSSIPLSYLPSKTMGCFSGRLMSAASDQRLFCKLCSPFCCSFNEFVEEKVITPSYSSAILTPPPLPPWNFQGKCTGMGILLQWIFPIQGLNLCFLYLLHWQADSLTSVTQEDNLYLHL